MYIVLIVLVVIALIFAPQWWARLTFKRYARDLAAIPGTGGELARHLLDRFDLATVGVEKTDPGGDHYDPESRTVRLSPAHFDGRSLTAVAVAAHEVGHAIQHKEQDARLNLRTNLIRATRGLQQVGALAMVLMPVAMVLTKSPAAGGLMFLLGLMSIASSTLVHLVTLPVEFDASFGKALPILREGYIEPRHAKAVEQILRAAALTYVAASLASLLNVARWIALLRR